MRVSVSLSDRERHDWEDDAACRQVDSELFWPQDSDRWAARRAKAVCQDCDVRAECLEAALTEGHDEGIWGGMSPRERAAVARSRAKKTRAAVMSS